jgi:hypothetical protein
MWSPPVVQIETIIEQNGTSGKPLGRKNIANGSFTGGQFVVNYTRYAEIIYSLLDNWPRKQAILSQTMEPQGGFYPNVSKRLRLH